LRRGFVVRSTVGVEAMSDKGRRGPSGPFSIGRALDIPAGSANDDLRRAVDAIDRVHGTGLLPRIPLMFYAQLEMPGRFEYNPVTGTPISISIRLGARDPAFIVVHEIAHLIDLVALGHGPDFGSETNPLLSNWLRAATDSAALREMSTVYESGQTSRSVEAMAPGELWARSYAQYIAIRSHEAKLLNGLNALRTRTSSGLHIPLQWDDNDFENIAVTIEALFYELGWRE
jgi:hypothetical protein